MWVHDIDPIALDLGFIQIHWYGLMYLIGFAAAWGLGSWRAKQPGSGWTEEQISDLIFWGALGVVIGGRFGYVLFYNFDQFLANPLWLFAVWEGGMSFHGGLLGVCVALVLFCKKRGFPTASIADLAAGAAPIGLGFGRLGNFINGELFGRATNVEWCMVFPHGGPACRHPSQLYEAGLEGLALFILLTIINRRNTPAGTIFWTFIAGYGVARFFVEFFREPDSHLGFIFQWVTMGQLLCIPMIALGLIMILRGYRTAKVSS